MTLTPEQRKQMQEWAARTVSALGSDYVLTLLDELERAEEPLALIRTEQAWIVMKERAERAEAKVKELEEQIAVPDEQAHTGEIVRGHSCARSFRQANRIAKLEEALREIDEKSTDPWTMKRARRALEEK